MGDHYLNRLLKLNTRDWAEPDNGRNWLHSVWILEWTQRAIWYDSTLYRNRPHVLRYSSLGYSKAIAIFWRMVGPSVTVKLQLLCSSEQWLPVKLHLIQEMGLSVLGTLVWCCLMTAAASSCICYKVVERQLWTNLNHTPCKPAPVPCESLALLHNFMASISQGICIT